MHQHHWRSHTRFARRSEEHWANEPKALQLGACGGPVAYTRWSCARALSMCATWLGGVRRTRGQGRTVRCPWRSHARGSCARACSGYASHQRGDSRAGALSQCLVRRCEVPQRLR